MDRPAKLLKEICCYCDEELVGGHRDDCPDWGRKSGCTCTPSRSEYRPLLHEPDCESKGMKPAVIVLDGSRVIEIVDE